MSIQQNSQLRRGEHHDQALTQTNVGHGERTISLVIGGALAAVGALRGGFSAMRMPLNPPRSAPTAASAPPITSDMVRSPCPTFVWVSARS